MNVSIYGRKVNKQNIGSYLELIKLLNDFGWNPVIHSELKQLLLKKSVLSESIDEFSNHNDLKSGIDLSLSIGGDGTFTGASIFGSEFDIPMVGVPGTIDNDLYGTDKTIGYDSALNTAMEAIDKIRDTANSHQRLFLVEVMGRDAGFLALRSGIAGGAIGVLVPETSGDKEKLFETLRKGWNRTRKSMIAIVAEGEGDGAMAIAEDIKVQFPNYDTKVSILGHMQRGGNPTCGDRVLASQMGLAAVEGLMAGKDKVMTGLVGLEIEFVPLDQSIKHHKDLSTELVRMVDILAS